MAEIREEHAMAHAYDLVIRGGELVDGAGRPAVVADVAVKDGVIAAVGKVAGSGAEEIDARGLVVAPGFVDIHTHYDGQATWDQRMQPSSWHGVTTAVMGNCGVGFAPCRPADHDRLVRLMEGVEDIPFPVLAEGLPWNWESYPDYLDALAARRFDIDVGAQLPHAALRVHVMGERGANREPATAEDIAAMAAIAERAMQAGALGFSTSRTLNHRTSDGQPTPTLTAAEDELVGIAMGLKAAGKGVLQVVSDFADPEAEFGLLRRMVEASGRPLSFSLAQSPIRPGDYKTLLASLRAAVEDGLEMRAQVAVRPIGVLFGLELTMNPFSLHPTYRAMAKAPLAERVARLSDPAVRAQLLAEHPEGKARGMISAFQRMQLMGEIPDYEPTEATSIAAIAQQRGVSPQEIALDHMLTQGGRGLIYSPHLNYAEGSLDPAHAMLTHPDTVPGLSDGGAHVGTICDGSFPTTLITHWTRDRTRGPKLSLEQVIKMQAADTAATVGLHDRGRIERGLRADTTSSTTAG
jgi:N-acyl-D-aspartate/D-glutamate deacylase